MSAAIATSDARAMIERCQKDPAFFMREVLGCDAWPKQIEIMESVRDFEVTAVPSCHSSGKSWVAARIVLWFLFSHPRSAVITTAPTRRQVEGILWKEIGAAHRDALIPLGGERLTTELKLDDDWYAIGFTAPDYDPNRFQGFHAPFILVVEDEAAGVTAPISAQITSLLAGGHARRLQIGNPVESGSPFHHVCRKKLGNIIPISAFDTPNFTTYGITEDDIISGAWIEKQGGLNVEYPNSFLITPKWVAARFAEWGADSDNWRSRILGEFPLTVQGAYYGGSMQKARTEDRITKIEADPGAPVHTAWDLGFDDKTAIWFYQQIGNQVRLVSYYEHRGVGMEHYARILREWQDEHPGTFYGTHYAPHDVKQHTVGTGKSTLELAAGYGVEFELGPQLGLMDGIEAVRHALPKCWFDEEGCKDGIAALESYHCEKNPRTGEFRNRPEHDWASDGADAFRYLALTLQPPKAKRSKKRDRQPGGFMVR